MSVFSSAGKESFKFRIWHIDKLMCVQQEEKIVDKLVLEQLKRCCESLALLVPNWVIEMPHVMVVTLMLYSHCFGNMAHSMADMTVEWH